MTLELHVTKKGLKKSEMKMLKDYEMFVKAVCLIILLNICNTNSKSVPNESIAEQVKQFSEGFITLKSQSGDVQMVVKN